MLHSVTEFANRLDAYISPLLTAGRFLASGPAWGRLSDTGFANGACVAVRNLV